MIVWRGVGFAFLASLLGLGLLGLVSVVHAQSSPGEALLLKADRQIDPITQRYVKRGIEKGEKENFQMVIIQLDTPGGLLGSTEKIVQVLLNARVPVVVWVYPRGAFAASAGTFITAAANIAVMSEGASIGAASPVGAGGEDLPATLSEKAKNITAAMADGIAEKRERNRKALVSTVTEAKAFSASQAVEQGVVDFVASDTEELFSKLHGLVVKTAAGETTLDTSNLTIKNLSMNLAERFFAFTADPNIIGLLITLGAIGIFVELLHPGLVVPGVTGIILLVIGLVSLGTLPFNWAGIALLGLAAVLIFFEIQVPGLGFLGIGGIIAFILGALLLFSVGEPRLPGDPDFLKISLWLISVMSGIMAFFVLVVVTAVVRSRKIRYISGVLGLVGKKGRVTSDLSPRGTVQVASEMWTAVAEDEVVIAKGEEVEVVSVEGLTLKVRK